MLFHLGKKRFQSQQIDWLMWILTTTFARHYMDKAKIKKCEFIKKKGRGTHFQGKC
jgi:hypothetical protein